MLPLIDLCCPYCGETIALAIDDSAGEQAYVEDCHVCCRPIEITVRFDQDGALEIGARGEDEA